MACMVEGCKSHITRKGNTTEFVSFHRIPRRDAWTWEYHLHYNKTFEDRRMCHLWKTITHEYSDLPVCPQCWDVAACPFRNLTQHCYEVKLKTMLDNPYAIPFSFVVSLWGVLLFLLWKRREAYLYWIWEVNKSDTDGAMRPEYAVWFVGAEGSGAYSTRRHLPAVLKEIIVFGINSIYCYGFTAVLMTATRAALRLQSRSVEPQWDFRKINYTLYVLLAAINVFVTCLLEKTGRRLAHALAEWGTPRTPAAHEKELVLRMSTFTLVFNFSYLFHLAFIRGQLFSHPGSASEREHCGLLSCIDEVCIAILVNIIFKHVFLGFGNIFRSKRTDYNRVQNPDVPCWEREYLLKPLTDTEIMSKMDTLMVQLALATFFVSMVPLAPAIILIINIWMVRRWAEELLVRSRRPLLRVNWGLGCWNNVLQLLPIAAAVCNALATALNSNIFDVNTYDRYFPDRRYFADITMSFFNISTAFPYGNRTLNKQQFFPHFCLFPGKWNRIQKFYADGSLDRALEVFVPTVVNIHVKANKMEFLCLFIIMAALASMVLYRVVEQKPRDVAEAAEQMRSMISNAENPDAAGPSMLLAHVKQD